MNVKITPTDAARSLDKMLAQRYGALKVASYRKVATPKCPTCGHDCTSAGR